MFYCEQAAGFSNDVGLQDEGYFDALVRMFQQALKVISSLPEKDHQELLGRLDAVRRMSHDFGHGSALRAMGISGDDGNIGSGLIRKLTNRSFDRVCKLAVRAAQSSDSNG